MKTFVSIYRDKDGTTFVGEPTTYSTIDDLYKAERIVLSEIPSLASIDVCEIQGQLYQED